MQCTLCSGDSFTNTVNHYSTLMLISFFSPFALSLTVSRMEPFLAPALTVTTSLPLKSFIVGFVNGSNDVASPLQIPWNVPAPLTSTSMRSSACGSSVPFLSTNDTVI